MIRLAQWLRICLSTQEVWFQSLGWEDRPSPEGNGNPLQYSFLENPMQRGAWRATAQEVPKSWT